MLKKLAEERGIQVTINTTEDCNMRCTYCYEINKKKKSIPFEYCKKFIDLIVEDPNPCNITEADQNIRTYKEGILLDFIGGDSLMDVDLLDKICTYFVQKIYTSQAPNAEYFRNHYRFSISSNGTLFSRPEVRKFCEKWAKTNALAIGISIDGCPAIHDKNRIMAERDADGKPIGSMKYILENLDWYRSVFPETDTKQTKSTLAKDSIPYLFESLKFMHEDLGLQQINQNFIMEDAHLTEEDYKEFDHQMELCVRYVLQHCDDLYWSMIDYDQFAQHRRSEGSEWTEQGRCGSGSMPCLGINGNIYPCFRWAPHTQSKANPEPMICGDVHRGLYNKDAFNKVRDGAIRNNCTKKEECRNCEYESACSYCIGGCYAEFQEFIRATYICEITKLQCKWAKVYWNEYNKLKGLPLLYSEEFQLS